ncbi:hypothetical protein A2379_05240 [Candidatus Amesbacteria bacterium RIFOXYB1_FULL_47_13]|nr:MAG: hypothetical protein A2379_05240 [Candidatus Amesbacteria bacterium RIFOXYB1_FULL_47_13]HBC72509.1 hypothetical protein [Candidatus Amesbacteria bacterium]
MNGIRMINEAVVVFIRHESQYLMLKRIENTDIDPGLYNGVGGRVALGETYLDTAVRKVHEETGFRMEEGRFKLVGIVRQEGCKHGDWIIANFVVESEGGDPPAGWETKDGKLEWIPESEVLKKQVVADLQHTFPYVCGGQGIFYGVVTLDAAQNIVNVRLNLTQ